MKMKVCKYIYYLCQIVINCNGGGMVSVLASSVVDRGFEPRSGQTKYYEIDICCFFAKHTALRRKSKYWFVWNLDIMYRVGRDVNPWTVVSMKIQISNSHQLHRWCNG